MKESVSRKLGRKKGGFHLKGFHLKPYYHKHCYQLVLVASLPSARRYVRCS